MSDFDMILNTVVQQSPAERIKAAKNSAKLIAAAVMRDKRLNEEDGFVLTAMVVGTFIALDRQVTPNELAMFNNIFDMNLSTQELINLLNDLPNSGKDTIREIIRTERDVMVKAAYVMIGIILCISDGMLDPSEENYLRSLL